MDRRAFLTGVGSMGAAAAGGWAALESHARSARATGLAKAAGVGRTAVSKAANGAPRIDGLAVGFLPGSAGLLEAAMMGRKLELNTDSRWVTWAPSYSLPIYDNLVSISIGMMQTAQVAAAPDMLKRIEVVAHFALDGAPDFAPFNAWSYAGPGPMRKNASITSPLTFEAGIPDRLGLQVNYAFTAERLAPDVAASGMVYLPVGARDGPGEGLYVLAGPSRYTGTQPDFSEYFFSGNMQAPLLRNTWGTPDFDFVTLSVRRA